MWHWSWSKIQLPTSKIPNGFTSTNKTIQCNSLYSLSLAISGNFAFVTGKRHQNAWQNAAEVPDWSINWNTFIYTHIYTVPYTARDAQCQSEKTAKYCTVLGKIHSCLEMQTPFWNNLVLAKGSPIAKAAQSVQTFGHNSPTSNNQPKSCVHSNKSTCTVYMQCTNNKCKNTEQWIQELRCWYTRQNINCEPTFCSRAMVCWIPWTVSIVLVSLSFTYSRRPRQRQFCNHALYLHTDHQNRANDGKTIRTMGSNYSHFCCCCCYC